MTEEYKPCPVCGDGGDSYVDITLPTSCDGIEYVVCQCCGLRVVEDMWNEIPRGWELCGENWRNKV